MNEESNAVPQPDASAGENSQSTPSVVPEPTSKRRSPSTLNLRQQREISRTLQIGKVAQKAEYAGVLGQNKITALFVTTLINDATATRERSDSAVEATTAKEGCTAQESDTKGTLVASLRTIQSAARNDFMDTDPVKVKNYLVGEDITASRVALEGGSQMIIDVADAQRPGSIDTNFLVRVTDERTAYVDAHADQQSEVGTARQERQLRDDAVASIVARRKKLQYAADTAWPHTTPGTGKARVEFQLPKDRPFSY